MPNPAVVVVAYNRAASLRRLLASLDRADYAPSTTLLISIDAGNNQDVLETANAFAWRHGEKKVVYQPQNLGLRNHILHCGDLTREYGAIVLLEDDLFVSPMFYRFSVEAMRFYADDPRVAGVSLYTQLINVNLQLPFEPFPDDGDVYFMHRPSSWGQVWTAAQWDGFRAWYARNNGPVTAADPLPAAIANYSEHSWAKYFTKYCGTTDRYFVYPRESLSTNFGDVGAHFTETSTIFQASLQRFRKTYRFQPLADSIAVYDLWFEMLPDRLKRATPSLRDYDFTTDLYGSKRRHEVTTPYVLTSRPCRDPVTGFARAMRPPETNVIEGISGDSIYLAKTDDVDWKETGTPDHLVRHYYAILTFRRSLDLTLARLKKRMGFRGKR